MMEPHKLANLFPMMTSEELYEMGRDILENGQIDPIVVYEGKILDGRNRFQACQRAGVEPRVEEYNGTDPLAYVISLNLKRRHLTESQKAMIASELATMERGQPEKKSANLRNTFVSQPEAAEMLNVSTRSVQTAKKVAEMADENVVQAVKEGKVSINAARTLAELPPLEQSRIAALPEAEIKQEVKKVRGTQGTGQNEWYTPEKYVEAARQVLNGIDLDPASSETANERIKASKFYTEADNGLAQDWAGSVWMNPPYSQPLIYQFIEKLVDRYANGVVDAAIVLTHNYTDTKWFHLAQSEASAICFTKGRIGFLSPDGAKASPTQGQAFFYMGKDVEAFAAAFSEFGFIAYTGAQR